MKKPTVGIIGAGISGIVASKELKDVGVTDVEVFEMMPILGGVFAHYGWESGKLTSSSAFTWFSDFPIQDRQKHLNWPEWLAYLNSYVDNFGTRELFNFNCKVVDLTRNPEGGYDLTIHRDNWSNGWWSHPEKNEVKEEIFKKHFDYIVMGSGLHHAPNLPEWKGQCSFKEAGGKIIHSSEFQTADAVKDMNVIVAGGGESGSDIAWLSSKQAKQVCVSLRSNPGTLFPHTINGNTADIRDSRIMYSLPRAMWPMLVKSHRRFYETEASEHESEERKAAFSWAAKSNYETKNMIYTINACKSFGIPKAVAHNNAKVYGAICHFEGRTCYFKTGEVFEDVDMVIGATGFTTDISAIKEKKFKKRYTTSPRDLWNNMVSPGVDDFFLIGFCRPQQINLITCCEMQSRAMAQVVSGNKKLPSVDQMKQEIENHRNYMESTFARGKNGLVDFIYFVDGLAGFIGCAPDLSKILFSDFEMWFPMTYAPIQPSQYRLVGPGAKPELARDTIMKSPYYKLEGERRSRDLNLSMIALASSILDATGFASEGMQCHGIFRVFMLNVARIYIAATVGCLALGFLYAGIGMLLMALLFIKALINTTRNDLEVYKPPAGMGKSGMKSFSVLIRTLFGMTINE